MFALPEPSIKFDGLDIVLTLALFKVNSWKYFLFLMTVCVVALFARHKS